MGDRDWAPRAIVSENICEPKNRYVQDSLAECYRLARTLRRMLISLEPWHAHLPRVLGAVRIALERAEVQRPIPWTSIQRVKEGRVDSKRVKGVFQHLECTCMKHAHGATHINSHAIEREKSTGVKSQKSMHP